MSADIRPGTPVAITRGALRGRRAVVLERVPWDFARGVPLYRVQPFGVVEESLIRRDYLEPQGSP